MADAVAEGGGTGQKLASALTAVAGVASLLATLASMVSIWLQTKNYRKPLLQRYVVRILLMVPLYSISSWSSMVSVALSAWFDPVRDIYEAFTIYTFFQLLINYLGGERSLIIMTHGREPVNQLWPMNHVLPPADISDPYTFLAIKRGILQYAWLKPILALAAVIMKATGTYHEGYLGLDSGYMWSGLLYNISMTISLYCLGLFWVCTHHDLKPFRPVPKFLCIKLIIFASYWQGFFLSILVWLGAISDGVEGYSADNLAAAIQDFLICIEMPFFAVWHWYAFSWHDFADDSVEVARMPVKYALRDSFGVRDLIEDSKETFKGDKYAYRLFDSRDKIMAHEGSSSRMARINAGMRYERGGKGKYWIPKPGEISAEINPYTPLLGDQSRTAASGSGSGSNGGPSRSNSATKVGGGAGTMDEDPALDPDEELLYDKARKLEFGDWNYPVVPANVPTREWNRRPSPTFSYEGHRSSASALIRSSLAVDSRRPRKTQPPQQQQAPDDDEGALVASSSSRHKKKSKGKQKQTQAQGQGQGQSSTDAGRATSPHGTRRPGVQADDDAKPDLSELNFDVSKPGEEDDDEREYAETAALISSRGGTTSDNAGVSHAEETSHWAAAAAAATAAMGSGAAADDDDDDEDAHTPVDVSPRYDIDEDEEFRNVWGTTERQPGRQKHL